MQTSHNLQRQVPCLARIHRWLIPSLMLLMAIPALHAQAPKLTDEDVEDVIGAVKEILSEK